MSIREVTYYQGACDWPGCTSDPHNDYSAWADADGVLADMEGVDWWFGRDGDHYCLSHPVAWEGVLDEENAEPPYLLIHDDVTVTYRRADA